jgi:hypothetical protein
VLLGTAMAAAYAARPVERMVGIERTVDRHRLSPRARRVPGGFAIDMPAPAAAAPGQK